MEKLILSLLTIALYLFTALWQGRRLFAKSTTKRQWLLLSGLTAVMVHTLLLYFCIEVDGGQNLNLFIMLSLSLWLIAILILFAALNKPVENLLVIVFPLAALTVLLVLLFPLQQVTDIGRFPRELVHILLSVAAFSVLFGAAMQALLLTTQNQLLKHHSKSRMLQVLPPLEVMESLLFQMIWIGFGLLTLVVISSLYAFPNVLAAGLVQKTLLALLAWSVFAILLWGRHQFGWRGTTAVQWTLSGVGLLMLCYVGSIVLLKMLI